ncbi:MAG: SufS family cysteine desulfurase [Alphaproteobacteria bacterium]|nr:SufS family cysteine desulfurase [Alphaproteobacteria bacterium]
MLMNGWMKMFKSDFPIFQNHPELVFLDSAASAQKPNCVLDAMIDFYTHSYSNVHRGNCEIAGQATELYENARQVVAEFIGTTTKNIVFTSGATAAVNMVVNGYEKLLKAGDEVLVFIGEHHADFVPWQQVCKRTGATFKIIGVRADGTVDMDDFTSKLSDKTKLVAVTHLSNVLGVVNPVRQIADIAHKKGAKVLVDGAQSIAHIPVNVSDLECDYFVFSGHKLYGPTGIGVLYGKTEALDLLPPTVFGGDMVREVSLYDTTFADVPARLEAGTPPFVQAHGLAAAIRYVSQIGMDKIAEHEQKLTDKLLAELKRIPHIQILGNGVYNSGLISFNIHGIHPADIAFMLAKQNICVRVGHHCAMPIHTCLKNTVSLRVSFGLYNDEQDVDTFIGALKKALTFF